MLRSEQQRAGLEVSTANQEVDFLVTQALQLLHRAIYLVQVSMAAALHSYLRNISSSEQHLHRTFNKYVKKARTRRPRRMAAIC